MSMGSQAEQEFSLRRSASLGLEVLERASRRSVDWTAIRASSAQPAAERTQSELRDAFGSITSFMAQTSHHCQKFYESDSCRELSAAEMAHISRFHRRPGPGQTTSTQPRRKSSAVLPRDEDFYIEVSPGMYSVSASVSDSDPQTRLVSIQPGESVVLNFNF